jgi:hypothetical protein
MADTMKVTPEAVELFRRAIAIEQSGDASEAWEEEGGKRREYLNLSVELHRALALKIWELSPLGVADDNDDTDEPGSVRNTAQAVKLRRELLAALGS